jgi:hypothetical protein
MGTTDDRWLSPEWMQLGLDALTETVGTGPDLKRQMIEFLLRSGLWDGSKMTYESALNRFNACLNPSQPETFKTAHIWALMKRFGRHQLFFAMAKDLGYEVRPVPTEERRLAAIERLTLAIEQGSDVINRARDELVHLEQPGAAVRPHAAFRAPGGSFSHGDGETSEPGGF